IDWPTMEPNFKCKLLDRIQFNMEKQPRHNQWWRIRSRLARECLAEAAGCFIMMALVNGGIAQVVLGDGKKGDYLASALGSGVAIMLGIHASGGISGGHLNSTITFSLAVYGRFPWKKVPFYIASQVIGSFLGAAAAFVIFYPALNEFDPDRTVNKTAGIFATYPMHVEHQGSAFACETLASAILIFSVFSLEDPHNMPVHPATRTLTIGLLVMVLILSFGMPTGVAMNLARDFGPRLFTAVAGWGVD
ncbi:unnamed protein product, partial [Aphanomyces euteiches]